MSLNPFFLPHLPALPIAATFSPPCHPPSTMAAHLRTGEPRITVDHLLPFLLSNPFEDAEELTECQVAHLLSPQPLHPLKVQCLKVQHIELIC
jgi:hypothetical protein